MTPEDIKKCREELQRLWDNEVFTSGTLTALETALKVLDEWEALKPICAGTPKRIAELEQDLARMRTALEKIASADYIGWETSKDIAQQALNGGKK